MRFMKKVFAFTLVVALAMNLMGCSKTEVKEETKTEPVKTTTESKTETTKEEGNLDPMTISIGFWDANDVFEDDDEIYKLLQEKFNVTFEGVSVSWSDYKEKYKLWAASGELPDIFAVDEINSQTYNTWIQQGVVRPLPQDLSKYPALEKAMGQPDVLPLKKDGSYYMIPRFNYPSTDMWRYDRGIVVRKDWLENLGLEVPKTFEDYKVVLDAFVNKDPDGNGNNDTIGLTHKSLDFMQVFFLGSVPQVLNDAWVKEDGQWIPGFYSKNLTVGISQLKELYDEGLLDRDFAVLKTFDGQNKFAEGKVGMLAQQVSTSALRQLEEKWVKYDHETAFEDAVAILPAWQHMDGNTYSFTQTTYWSESYFSGDVDDEKMERILMIYDYLKSPEFIEMKTYGIEGKDFVKEGDNYKILLEKNEQGLYPTIRQLYPCMTVIKDLSDWGGDLTLVDNEINRVLYGDEVMEMVSDFSTYCEENILPMPTNFDIKLMSTPAKDQLSAIRFFDDVIKVIMTDGDVETEWNQVRENYKQYNIEEAIKEVNTKATEMGIN